MKPNLKLFSIVFLLLAYTARVNAQDSEYKDTPWFSGMNPNQS
jgi:hypothetical protein